jgi:parallel beta-helix repeat protein
MDINPLNRKCLVVEIILLFIGTCIIPAIAQDIEKPPAASRENWLYVGGNGPGNYTKIQDAINASSDGDTIFVYDDSSPYYQFFDVDKSISLIGENKNTTIIDSQQKRNVIHILADKVLLTGFTIQTGSKNSDSESDGVWIYRASNVVVTGNILRDSFTGIVDLLSSHSTISNNIVVNNTIGIDSVGSTSIIQNNTVLNQIVIGIDFQKGFGVQIKGNTISYAYQQDISWGISGRNTAGNIITGNNISHYNIGISIIYNSLFNIISQNNIMDNNRYGINLDTSSFNIITKNNFINNYQNAWFVVSFRNHWIHNYWDDWDGKGPERINGLIGTLEKPVQWINFDWIPVKEPYIIGG